MNVKQLIFLLFMIAAVVTMASYGLYITENSKSISHNVPCYDRFSNQIQDVICTEDSMTYPEPEIYVFIISLLITIAGIVFLPIIIPALGDYDKEAYF